MFGEVKRRSRGGEGWLHVHVRGRRLGIPWPHTGCHLAVLVLDLRVA